MSVVLLVMVLALSLSAFDEPGKISIGEYRIE